MPTATGPGDCRLHWLAEGTGRPILLIHGFASDLERNWRATGWLAALARAGWRVVAYDQRGHGKSDRRYHPDEYALPLLVGDALAVADAAGLERAILMGYSMGARIALEVALTRPDRVAALVLGGVGKNFFPALGGRPHDRELVAGALEADDPSPFPPAARTYRSFAEQGGGDRRALAACYRRPERPLDLGELRALGVPALVVVGGDDRMAGDPRPLAEAIPGARLVPLPGKDHMKAVGAKEHRAAVIDFLASLPR